jgi:hypothetical protein
MTEQQLISQFKALKHIAPRKEWVVLSKRNILGNEVLPVNARQSSWQQLIAFFSANNQKTLAYSFGTLVFIFAGIFGFAQYTLPGDMLFEVRKIAEQSQAALTGGNQVKTNVETLKKRSQDLAHVVRDNKNNNKLSAIKEVQDATTNLTVAIENDSALAKEVALEIKSNQTLLAVLEQEDLKEASDTLYKTIDTYMIEDLEKATLTEEQQILLTEVKALFEVEKYSEALEKILLISQY